MRSSDPSESRPGRVPNREEDDAPPSRDSKSGTERVSAADPAPISAPRCKDDPVADSRSIPSQVDQIYRQHSRRVLATLLRQLRDLELAEEALHEAFRAAMEQWPRDGIPSNPRGVAGINLSLQGDRRSSAAQPTGTAGQTRGDTSGC